MSKLSIKQKLICNRSHIKIKNLRELQHESRRRQQGTFIAEGIRFLHQAVEHGAHIEYMVVAPALLQNAFGRKLVDKLIQRGIPSFAVSVEVFQSIAMSEEPNGVLAVVRQRLRKLPNIRQSNGLCWIALSHVHSPGNLGTILRCAQAVNACGLILIGDQIDPYASGCVRSSMGALFTQQFVRCTLKELLEWKERERYSLFGTTPIGAVDYQTPCYPERTILFMGSERKGLSAEEQRACDRLVSIPMQGRLDSLNLAMATTLMLYEVFNQRRRMLVAT